MFKQYDTKPPAELASPATEITYEEREKSDLGWQSMMDPKKIIPVPHPQADCMMCWLCLHPDAKGPPVDGLCLAHIAIMYGVDLSEEDLSETDDRHAPLVEAYASPLG